MVGEPLFDDAVDAHRRWQTKPGSPPPSWPVRSLPEPVWPWLQDRRHSSPASKSIRQVPDLRTEMARSAVTVSQCGYNTTMDILRAGIPAVVVPFAEGGEDEQRQRAERLDDLGVLRCVSPEDLDADRLADAVIGAATTTPAAVSLDLDGRRTSARLIAELSTSSDVGATV